MRPSGAVKMHYCVWTFLSAMSTISLIPSLCDTVAPPRHRVYRVRLDVAAAVLFVSSPLHAIAPCFVCQLTTACHCPLFCLSAHHCMPLPPVLFVSSPLHAIAPCFVCQLTTACHCPLFCLSAHHCMPLPPVLRHYCDVGKRMQCPFG